MFVCRNCVKNYFIRYDDGWAKWNDKKWDDFLGKSYGNCEDCHEVTTCLDIPHSRYAHKESQFAKENNLLS